MANSLGGDDHDEIARGVDGTRDVVRDDVARLRTN
jgi:hypothetical protein